MGVGTVLTMDTAEPVDIAALAEAVQAQLP